MQDERLSEHITDQLKKDQGQATSTITVLGLFWFNMSQKQPNVQFCLKVAVFGGCAPGPPQAFPSCTLGSLLASRLPT